VTTDTDTGRVPARRHPAATASDAPLLIEFEELFPPAELLFGSTAVTVSGAVPVPAGQETLRGEYFAGAAAPLASHFLATAARRVIISAAETGLIE
jgi:hypothetical protein